MKRNPVDFLIVSTPVAIKFDCPQCGEDVEIAWDKVDRPSCWSDEWPEIECPHCGKTVALGEWNYD